RATAQAPKTFTAARTTVMTVTTTCTGSVYRQVEEGAEAVMIRRHFTPREGFYRLVDSLLHPLHQPGIAACLVMEEPQPGNPRPATEDAGSSDHLGVGRDQPGVEARAF